jgi:hypothetical protein
LQVFFRGAAQKMHANRYHAARTACPKPAAICYKGDKAMASCFSLHRAARHAARAGVVLLVVALTVHALAATAAGPKNIALGDPTGVGAMRNAPGGIPDDYVVTPNGFFHPSCVQRVESDETLRANGTVTRSDGSVRQVAACAYPHYAADGTRLINNAVPQPSVRAPANPPDINGWVAYGSYTLPRANASVYIAANMSVPTAPAVHSGQVVYFFPGLEDIEHVQTIVQPVLGWNAFNDNGWTIASWNCCMNGQTWHSPPVTVNPGVTLEGRVNGTNCDGSECANWTILTRDPVNDHDTTLNTDGYGQVFDWVFGAVLEAYGITQCGELPQSRTEEFSRIVVYALRSPVSAPVAQHAAWEPTILASAPACDYLVGPFPQPNSPQITIKY